MADLPTFSVVVPTYNYAHFLGKAIESILIQGREDTQILLVDDASTDNTPEVAKSFESKIHYIRNDKNLGAAGSWRTGLKLAHGKYLIKLDADDELEPGCFDAIEQAFRSDPEIGIVLSSVWVNREHKRKKELELIADGDQTLTAEEFRLRLLKKFFFRMPGCALRREFLLGHALPVASLYQIHDWEYFLRVTKGHKARLLANPGGTYLIHSKSITATAQSENRLINDINSWLEFATFPGEHQLSSQELIFLRKSCAELMFIDYKRQNRFLGLLHQYPKAIGVLKGAGAGQMVHFHWSMLLKALRKALKK